MERSSINTIAEATKLSRVRAKQQRRTRKKCQRCLKPLGPHVAMQARFCYECRAHRDRESCVRSRLKKHKHNGIDGRKNKPCKYAVDDRTEVTWRTTAFPGTEGKIEVLRKRFERKETLFHPEDLMRTDLS